MTKDVSRLKIINDSTEYLFKDLLARENISSLLGSGVLTSLTLGTFFAAPSNKDGVPSFRKITASDLPVLNQDTTGIASYARGLIGRDTSGNYFDTSNGHVIIAEWNTKSDNRWYLKAAETYECRVDYATKAGTVETLDGYRADDFVKSIVNNTDNFTRFTNRAFFQTAYISGQGDFGALVIPTWYNNNSSNYYTTELRFGLGSYNPMIRYTHNNSTSDWKTLALTSDIPKVTDYYWANIPISVTSNANTSPTFALPTSIYSKFTNGSEIIGYIGRGGSDDTLFFGNYKSAGINIFVDNNTSNCIFLKTGGSVGIGTTSPSAKLHVAGDTLSDASVSAGTSITSTTGDFYVGGTSGSRCHIKMDTTNKCVKFIFD